MAEVSPSCCSVATVVSGVFVAFNVRPALVIFDAGVCLMHAIMDLVCFTLLSKSLVPNQIADVLVTV